MVAPELEEVIEVCQSRLLVAAALQPADCCHSCFEFHFLLRSYCANSMCVLPWQRIIVLCLNALQHILPSNLSQVPSTHLIDTANPYHCDQSAAILLLNPIILTFMSMQNRDATRGFLFPMSAPLYTLGSRKPTMEEENDIEVAE